MGGSTYGLNVLVYPKLGGLSLILSQKHVGGVPAVILSNPLAGVPAVILSQIFVWNRILPTF